MKKKYILPAFCALGALLFFVLIAARVEPAAGRTEEYVIVDAKSCSAYLYIRVVDETKPLTKLEWQKLKTEADEDIMPLLKKLHELNQEGFQVATCASSVTSAGWRTYTYTLRRKL